MKSTKPCLFVKLKPYYHDAWKSGNLCRNKTFLVVKYHYNTWFLKIFILTILEVIWLNTYIFHKDKGNFLLFRQ